MPKGYLSDEKFMIALGRIPKARSIHKFGARTGVRNDRESTVWDGDELYPWDAFDTAGVATVAGGSDAGKSVYVVGLDNNYDEVSEEIAVGSTGTVEFKRIFRGYMAGTEANDGDISVTVNTQEVMKIAEGNSQTLMSIYTVPRNHTALLLKGVATSAKDKDMQVKFYGRFIDGNGLYTPFRIQHIANIYQNQYIYEFVTPLAMPEKTDLDVRVLGYGSDTGAHVTAAFDLILYEIDTDY
jgi:hypothetical protein